MSVFTLQSDFQPAWDQPQAIQTILDSFSQHIGHDRITLLGATWTGKTFTMAHVIQAMSKPTLIISHNKTLAAQLATEFKHFFPHNAVHYFVSYFDYYQPESYLPDKDIYIEKESTINQEIEMYRLSAMSSLITRPDTIIVSSVSALYGLWEKEFFAHYSLNLTIGDVINHKDLKKKLIDMRYESSTKNGEQGTFNVRWDMWDIYPSTEKALYRLHFTDGVLEYIEKKDSLTWEPIDTPKQLWIWPASQYMQDTSELEPILVAIEQEMRQRVDELTAQGKLLEANRIEKRTLYDIRMIKETGFTNGIENYSMYFEKRKWGDTPNTIFDYFPDDMLVIIDESHMTVPQLQSMPSADFTRKKSLIDHGFRLPSASQHRPLSFDELQTMIGRNEHELKPETLSSSVNSHIKSHSKTLFVSATPANYEIEHSTGIAEQVIRPTWLLDPVTYVYPKSGDYQLLLSNLDHVLKKKPYLEEYVDRT